MRIIYLWKADDENAEGENWQSDDCSGAGPPHRHQRRLVDVSNNMSEHTASTQIKI